MNPLTGLTNQDALARYARYQPGKDAATQGDAALSLQYMRLQADTVEISADGQQRYAVSKTLEVLYASVTSAVAETGEDETVAAPATPAADDYFSPENTAQRIMDFALSFFPAFSANHAELAGTDALQEQFRELMRGAIEEGFAQARGLLDEFFSNDTPDAVTGAIGQTYELLQQKLDAFSVA